MNAIDFKYRSVAAFCSLIIILLLAPACLAQEPSPLDDILGITKKEETKAIAGEVISVTGSNGHIQTTILIPLIFSEPQGVVRVVAKNIDSATHYFHCGIMLNYGADYYPWANEDTAVLAPGEEKKMEVAYELATLNESTRARITAADMPGEEAHFPPDGIFLSIALTPETIKQPGIWRPKIQKQGLFTFHMTPGLLSDEEFNKLADSYEKALARLDEFWSQKTREYVSVYLLSDEAERDRFIVSEDEQTQYLDAVVDFPKDGKYSDPGERLSWMASIYLGDPPPLFHDAVALLMQEKPQWRDRPLKEWARIQESKQELIALESLLTYDSTDPKDATREIGIPALASFCDYLLSVKDAGSFREAFMLMNRGNSKSTRAHNANVLANIYGQDLESLEKAWHEWISRKPGETGGAVLPDSTASIIKDSTATIIKDATGG